MRAESIVREHGRLFRHVPRIMRFSNPRKVQGLLDLSRRFPERSVGLEIGSFAGESALVFMLSGRVETLHCVDPWSEDDYAAGRIRAAERAFDAVAAMFPGRVVKHKARSIRALTTSPLCKLRFDWGYVDGDHEREAVETDVSFLLPLVKPGGFVCGHDYGRPDMHHGVTEAVDALLGGPDERFCESSWLKRVGGLL